ncbi:MAG: EthD family reductase [Alphaproteobacteria bacterium]|nr:EthD family reductase [Alphaproteobacteria bacterium]
MIKLTFCLRRLPHLSREQFQDYWLNHHGPLVRSQMQAMRVRRYVQTHSLGEPALSAALNASRGSPEPYDGIAELYWDSREALQAVGKDPAGREAGRILLEDERKFIDLPNSPLWYNEEHEIISLRETGDAR